MPANAAAWLPAKHAKLKVGAASYRSPHKNEIVIRTCAVAVNPVDWIKQMTGDLMFAWIKYPCILGSDVAGEVVEVGSAVVRFKVGDRVLGHALGTSKARNEAAQGAFQNYTVLVSHMATPIPADMTFERAAVLPLAISTAACSLFQADHLALHHPSASPKPTGKTLLVWGGSTSVGSNAIQLAVAAGYEVIATASPRNFDYVKGLGAVAAFDYNSKTVAEDVIRAFDGRISAGAIAIGQGSADVCLDIVHACKGDKFVSTASAPVAFDDLPERGGMTLKLLGLMFKFVSSGIAMALKARRLGVRTKFIFGDTLADNEVGSLIYVDFLPRALAEGRYIAAPDPMVVGKGLEAVQTGFEIQKEGVSAKKVVVAL
jgi:NADPH:quinone reductase-like Zn-dependent oxidoreductase